MRQWIAALFAVSLGSIAAAQVADGPALPEPPTLIESAEGRTLDEFLWTKRPLVVFADNAADPRFVQQMQFINERPDALLERGQ